MPIVVSRHDPASLRAPIGYRPRSAMPFDADVEAHRGLPLMLDTTCYIDALKDQLPDRIAGLLVERNILHSAVARAELAVAIGTLDPADPRTASNLGIIRAALERMPAARILAPSPQAWTDAAVAAGILARLLGVPKEARRALLNDALLFEGSREAGALLVSRNIRHLDLLLQLDPKVPVLLYDR